MHFLLLLFMIFSSVVFIICNAIAIEEEDLLYTIISIGPLSIFIGAFYAINLLESV